MADARSAEVRRPPWPAESLGAPATPGKAQAFLHGKGYEAVNGEIEVEKLDPHTYRRVALHDDTSSWREMVCDAFGTRSAALAEVFLNRSRVSAQFDGFRTKTGRGPNYAPTSKIATQSLR